MIPFGEHRPETVSETVWTEYVAIMTSAGYGKATGADVARLDEIYAQAPEILAVGRGLDFRPRF